jgi:nucleoside 2-deoxyribosyltransferase
MLSLRPKVYFVGPSMLSSDAKGAHRTVASICAQHGLECLWPSERYLLPDGQGEEIVLRGGKEVDAPVTIYRSMRKNIRNAGAVVVDISPFRGPHMDSQTALELGIAHAEKKPIFAFTTSYYFSAFPDEDGFRRRRFRMLAERIWTGTTPASDGYWRDEQGYQVENFGKVENAVVECALLTLSETLEEAIAVAARHFEIKKSKMGRL